MRDVTEGIHIGPQLRAARKLRGIATRQELARRIDRAGFGEKVIGQVERGERSARDYEIAWLAQALDMTVEELTRAPAAEPTVSERLGAIERRVTTQLAHHAERVENLLDGQDKQLRDQTRALGDMKDTLAEIRDEQKTLRGLIADEQAERVKTETATRDLLALLEAVDASTRANLDAARRAEEARGKSAT